MRIVSAAVALLMGASKAQNIMNFVDKVENEFEHVIEEFTDSAEELRNKKNRYGNIETVISNDTDNGVFEKLIELGGDSNHYYFDYEQ